jgi:hypothetical protein
LSLEILKSTEPSQISVSLLSSFNIAFKQSPLQEAIPITPLQRSLLQSPQ